MVAAVRPVRTVGAHVPAVAAGGKPAPCVVRVHVHGHVVALVRHLAGVVPAVAVMGPRSGVPD